MRIQIAEYFGWTNIHRGPMGNRGSHIGDHWVGTPPSSDNAVAYVPDFLMDHKAHNNLVIFTMDHGWVYNFSANGIIAYSPSGMFPPFHLMFSDCFEPGAEDEEECDGEPSSSLCSVHDVFRRVVFMAAWQIVDAYNRGKFIEDSLRSG